MSEKPIFNVTSYNQQGGITAGQVNIGSRSRHLTDILKRQLLDILPKTDKITITSVLGDGEAFQFASEIKDYLEAQQYNVAGVDQAVYSRPIMGQILEPKEDGMQIIIGTREG